jgi:hypothetical protein
MPKFAKENLLLWGDVLAQNQPMLEMVKRLGVTLKKDPEAQTFRAEMLLSEGPPGARRPEHHHPCLRSCRRRRPASLIAFF